MGVILGLLAAILWGFGDLLARFAGQAIGAWRTLFYSELAGVLFLTAWLALSTDGGGPPVPDLTVWAWAVGLVAAAGFGVAFWVQGAMLVPTIGSLPSVWLFLAFGVVVMGAAGLIGFGSLAFPPREAIPVTFGSGSLAVAAYIAVALGFATGQIAIVAVLSTLSSVITAILGYFVLGERLADRQIVGVVLIIVGVVIINVA
jgi:drug/metabolite transporter (DMT)-like permease